MTKAKYGKTPRTRERVVAPGQPWNREFVFISGTEAAAFILGLEIARDPAVKVINTHHELRGETRNRYRYWYIVRVLDERVREVANAV
jgi:hypothetical protein